jgi:hypothetical protein
MAEPSASLKAAATNAKLGLAVPQRQEKAPAGCRRYKGENYGGGGAVIFSPIFVGYHWHEGGSEEHSQDWLCHEGKRKEPAALH